MKQWIRFLIILLSVVISREIIAATVKPEKNQLLQKAMEGPLKNVEDIIFCTRSRYDDGHWYANIGYYCDDENKKAYAGNGKPDDGRLYKMNLRTKALTVLLDAQGGSIRDPQIHYDGKKILLSYRKANTDFYHLYEINIDGSGLKQLTSEEFDDYEPIYLPDGDIIFVSTRCKRWVNCWYTQVGTIYRCNADGKNICQLSSNTEHDNTPWVMPDGRILYMRWEYVDRSQVEYHHLWTMNPDGTGQTVYYGNMYSWIVMIDAKPIPGTQKIVASFSPGHGINEHNGVATIVTPEMGPDHVASAKPLHKGAKIRDPYPLSENCFLMAKGKEVIIMDDNGNEETIYNHPGDGGVHEPRPVMPRDRELITTRRTKPTEAKGLMVLSDVYRGRNMEGVKRGDIKKLLVLESLPKPVNFSGGMDLVSWLGTFTLERVLGTVPVEADGSAYFELPANRQIFFVALDEKDMSVKRMQSWCNVMPGESVSCVGCHEPRVEAPQNRSHQGKLLAVNRPPSRIEPFAGLPDVIDFNRDIQPILNRNCIKCHDHGNRAGKLTLAGDCGPNWSHSYINLFARRQIADGENGLGNRAPRTIGTSASPLIKKIDGSHHDAKPTPQEWRTIWLWIESGAPYTGTYAGLRNTQQQHSNGVASGSVLGGKRAIINRRCISCHKNAKDENEDGSMSLPYNTELARKRNKKKLQRPMGSWERLVIENDPGLRRASNILVNFSRPEFSPLLLGPLAKSAGGYGTCGDVFKDKNDPDYKELLDALVKAKTLYEEGKTYGSPTFQPNPQYIREMKKYGILPKSFDITKNEIDVFQTDQKYWQSFWYVPETSGGE
ncbi:MAG: hypothetical protein A2283_10255 [Lentisphaerae bacterium RIFOXYA12_FULL_48_11]|nr:MAG: hypothetical protein A2283_10255 [Lentisphaerae bacterium RIFOXYA12_FULL_48_11]